MERWRGKTAVVTGASVGIGAAVCVTLANAGLKVVGLARRPQLVDELQSQVTGTGSIVSRRCDVSSAEELSEVFRWVEECAGGTDVLVNNAGVMYSGYITDLGQQVKDDNISSLIDVNLKGAIFCTRHAITSMKKRAIDGHVVIINSIAGHYIPYAPEFNVYSSSKHGVTAFTSALIGELAHVKSRIKVTSISPGLVNTDMTSGALDLVDFAPLQPQDIADAVLYAVSTPPHVNITELTIQPIAEKKL